MFLILCLIKYSENFNSKGNSSVAISPKQNIRYVYSGLFYPQNLHLQLEQIFVVKHSDLTKQDPGLRAVLHCFYTVLRKWMTDDTASDSRAKKAQENGV